MAGNPLAKLIPHIKKNIIEIYIALGFIVYGYRIYTHNKTYRFVYSRNDFERTKHLEDLTKAIKHQQRHGNQSIHGVNHGHDLH